MSYWDTACLVKLYVPEPNSAVFEEYAASLLEGPVTGEFARLELWTVLRRKEAESSLAAGEAKQVLGVFDKNVSDGLVRFIPLNERVTAEFERVVEKCLGRMPPLFIRTLDAMPSPPRSLRARRNWSRQTNASAKPRLRSASRSSHRPHLR